MLHRFDSTVFWTRCRPISTDIMRLASEMLVACALIIEREIGADNARAVLKLRRVLIKSRICHSTARHIRLVGVTVDANSQHLMRAT